MHDPLPLTGRTAVVAGGTRGAGRGIAVQLGAAGATVLVTGRSTHEHRSDMGRPETIDQTAEMVTAAGGLGIAIRVDHEDEAQVDALVAEIRTRTERLDILVDDIWGGDPLTHWGTPFWRLDLADIDQLWRRAVRTHIVTSQRLVPLMLEQHSGLVVEITDGVGDEYRGHLGYDLVKTAVNRLAFAMADELRPHGIAVVAVSPGFLRSEAMLEGFGVTEETWQDAIARDRHFAASESPHFVGRAVAALAADPAVLEETGRTLTTWDLSDRYGFTDIDGRRPHWGRHLAEHLSEPA